MRDDSFRIASFGVSLIALGAAIGILEYFLFDLATLILDILIIGSLVVSGIAVLAISLWEPPV